LKNIRVPGSELVSSISWEGKGLRLAMAVGASIFFANIKPDHKWSWMNCGTIVFGYFNLIFCTDIQNLIVWNHQWYFGILRIIKRTLNIYET
jgi:hypothetical protein